MTVADRVVTRAAGEGDVAWLGEFPHATRLSGSDTGGALCVVECDAPRDASTPWHVHHRDDETFYVLEGEMIFYSGEEVTPAPAAGPGTLVYLPRGVPHAFVVESERARFLVLGTPAIQDAFFHAAGTPTPESGPPDFDHMARVAAEHGVELLGPPPRVSHASERPSNTRTG